MSDLRDLLANARGSAATAKVLSLDELRAQSTPARWGLGAIRGRLVELSSSGATATLTVAVELVVETQIAEEPVCWIALGPTMFYPPDLAADGVDLSALVVVRAPDATRASSAAEKILRSDAFGLVVMDLGTQPLPGAYQGRLLALAQAHDAALLCLTTKPAEAASLGSLVSMRAEALRMCGPADASGAFGVTVRVLKDKRHGPDHQHQRSLRGPAGFK